jgi:hypothetical protein
MVPVAQPPAEQRLFTQTSPAPHVAPALGPMQLPLAPQFIRFERGSMQLPPQSTVPAGHIARHAPPEHTCAPMHVVPALAPAQSPLAPQNAGSVEGSTQRPPQKMLPAVQLVRHRPLTQLCPAMQRVNIVHVASALQYSGLDSGSMHSVPQRTVPIEQRWLHTPATHSVPSPHGLSQRPQWLVLRAVSTHAAAHT